MAFTTPTDIANRACQHLGVRRITSFDDDQKQALELGSCYDKARRSELRRSVWAFAIRRMVLRTRVSTTFRLMFPVFAAGSHDAGEIVTDLAGQTLWISPRGTDSGLPPGSSLAGYLPDWIAYFGQMVAQEYGSGVQYYPGDIVYVSTALYLSIQAGVGHTPSSSATYWFPLTDLTKETRIVYSPEGYSPDASETRFIYDLPANYLRFAPQDPKTANTDTLNVSGGMAFKDWEIEGKTIATLDTSPIVLRFVADITDVTQMDDMFCEMLACRMALDTAPFMVQNPDRRKEIESLYKDISKEARLVNAVEAGSSEVDWTDGPPTPKASGE